MNYAIFMPTFLPGRLLGGLLGGYDPDDLAPASSAVKLIETPDDQPVPAYAPAL